MYFLDLTMSVIIYGSPTVSVGMIQGKMCGSLVRLNSFWTTAVAVCGVFAGFADS